MENPSSVLCKMFAWFVVKYGCTSADDGKTNRTAMALEWHPSQGLELPYQALLTVCDVGWVVFYVL
jgi:hypothetical protein